MMNFSDPDHNSIMSIPRVKICGITNPEEAYKLDELGVDFLGFNFYPKSKRYIQPDKATEIIRNLKHAVPVGVFVNEKKATLRSIHKSCGLQLIQLHGFESVEYIQSLNLVTIKTIAVANLKDLNSNSGQAAQFLLYDTKDSEIFGGTGNTFDWRLLNYQPFKKPYFLAGGLGPHNLKQAVEQTTPYAVDLNSQVEDAPGRKNLRQIEKCLKIIGR